MSYRHRLLVAAATVSIVAPLGAIPSTAQPAEAPPPMPAAATAVAWQRIAVRTIYTEGLQAPPVGALYLAFTSMAVHDAAQRAHGNVNRASAAVATAAHDVLDAYFATTSGVALDTALADTLAAIPDGPAETTGVRIGHRAAARMIASRVDDGRGDLSIVYDKDEAAGIWQPPLGGTMGAAWLGFVDPLVHIQKVYLNGPDPIGSAAYAKDYDEVRDLGSATDSARTQHQTDVANHFSFNPIAMYRAAVCDLLTEEPMGLRRTTRLFAEIDASVATTAIRTWRLKFDVGFWRPFEAVAGAGDDGNPATTPETGWVSLVLTPSYSDYTSGHASATAPFATVLRNTLGDDVSLHLVNPVLGTERDYTSLTQLEHDAFNARIWGGLHFRDAMEDGYYLGHVTARRVMRALR
jgi:hypothetical protein